MVCAIKKIDSNDTGFSLAEEECINELRQSGIYTDVIWHGQDVNSYNPPPGATYTRVARQPISRKHKRKKGNITDRDANFGINIDLTPTSFTWVSQGAFFANIHGLATTDPLNAPNIAITGVDADTNTFTAASGLGVFAAGNLVRSSGFTVAGNNGLSVVASSTAGTVVVSGLAGITDEPSPPVGAALEVVGHRFGSGGLVMSVTAAGCVLTAGAALPPIVASRLPGEWIFVGGDAAASRFSDALVGFARIKSIVGQVITLDKTDFVAAAGAGTGKTIELYFGWHVRDEPDENNFVRRTYSGEMTLGNDGAGVQSQYIDGGVINTVAVNAPLANIVTIDLGFVACNRTTRTGAQGLRGGNHVDAPFEEYAYNTTTDEVRVQLTPANGILNPTSVIGIVNNFTMTFGNNITPNKGQGILGPFDMNRGDFQVGMTANTYFTNVAAMVEIPNNTTFTFDSIFAANNTAVAFDIPALTLGGGDLEVVKDQSVMLNLANDGFESEFGTTASVTFFRYIPDIGMPTPDVE